MQAPQATLADRNQLITEHVAMARRIARKMARRLPQSVSREDLESAALLGLTEAACRYDNSRGEPFMAFAVKRVRGAVLDYLRKHDVLSRRARRSARLAAEVTRGLEAEFGRPATEAEVASALGMSVENYRKQSAKQTEAALIPIADLKVELPGKRELPEEAVARKQAKSHLNSALQRLKERQVTVLAYYYQREMTLRQIGEVLGVTESRVCQIHGQALKALRGILEEDERLELTAA